MDIVGHFKTITNHKILVAKGCFRVGLYWQGLTHDMSKYSPVEFIPGALYFTGTESPNNQERKRYGVSKAWLHHKGRNKHHFEYWLDYASAMGVKGLAGMKIPKKYMVEMFIDRVSAGKIYKKNDFTRESPLEYFTNGSASTMMYRASRNYLMMLLEMYAKKGEDATFSYLKWDLKYDISGYEKTSPFQDRDIIDIA